MLYGIDYRSFRTAIHGLLLYKEREEAFKAASVLRRIDNCEVKSDIDCFQLAQGCFNDAYALIEEIDFRRITENMKDVSFSVNHKGFISTETDDVEVINIGRFMDVF